MQALDFPDRHRVRAAEGWIELGLLDDAAQELSRLSPEGLRHADGIEARWRLLAARQDWAAALEAARSVTIAAPDRPSGWIHQSYSLHSMHRTQEAWDLLLPVVPRFPDEPVIPYNLACYACQLGRLSDARVWLRKALRLRDKERLKAGALCDPDLAPLRSFIAGL